MAVFYNTTNRLIASDAQDICSANEARSSSIHGVHGRAGVHGSSTYMYIHVTAAAGATHVHTVYTHTHTCS